MAWLNYHHLYYFFRVAELGTISKAAEELRLGQPAISLQIKGLEEQLGQLFDRSNRSLQLTERGKLVYKYAREIFLRGEELKVVLDRGQLARSRELSIGAQAGVPRAILADALRRIQTRLDVRIRVREGDAPVILDDLLDGKVDLMILDHEVTHREKTIVYIPIGKEKIYFWGADKYKHLAKDFPHSLQEAKLVLSSTGHPLRQAVENFLLSHRIEPQIVIDAPDTGLIKELGTSGVGVIALGERTSRGWAQVGRLHKIGSLPYVQKYSLGFLKKFLKDPLAELIQREFTPGKKS